MSQDIGYKFLPLGELSQKEAHGVTKVITYNHKLALRTSCVIKTLLQLINPSYLVSNSFHGLQLYESKRKGHAFL